MPGGPGRPRGTPQRVPAASPIAAAAPAASSHVTTRRPNSAPANSTTTAGRAVDGGEVLPKPPRRVPTAITWGTPVPGARRREFGPGVVHHADGGHRRQRHADVAVEPLRLFERVQVEDKLLALGAQLGHGV